MKVALFFGSFAGGGAERMMVNLAKGLFERSIDVSIYVVKKEGPFLKEVPEHIPIHSFEAKSGVKSVINKIRSTLRYDGLTTVISTQMHINAAVAIASLGLNNKPKIIFREANTPSKFLDSKLLIYFYKIIYKLADHFVAVSKGVKKDMEKFLNIDENKISVIYNPVIDNTITRRMDEAVSHRWFQDSQIKVVIGMGRLLPQKRFEDLIESFNKVNKSNPSTRLIIFGNKDLNKSYVSKLYKLIDELNLSNNVQLPGFTNNPFKYLKNASLFILSSEYEGLPGVLIQAMACGCNVVSTNCPSGPEEILENGKFGKLVEVGNIDEMALAIIESLNKKTDSIKLKKRANEFSVENASNKYLEIIN